MKKTAGNIFTSKDGSIIVDENFLVIMDAGCEEKTVKDFLSVAKKENKPIAYAFLSHGHWDHVHNTKAFREHFPGLVTIGHKNNRFAETKITQRQVTQIGSFTYTIMPTPGHSSIMDDICVLLEEKHVVFVGDLCQPQGPWSDEVSFVTPVPYFFNGERYLDSLKKILEAKFNFMITGHGEVYRKNAAEKALHITLETVKAMKQFGMKLARENKNVNIEGLADMIFTEVSKERSFDPSLRMASDDYKAIDRPGLLYWARYAKRKER